MEACESRLLRDERQCKSIFLDPLMMNDLLLCNRDSGVGVVARTYSYYASDAQSSAQPSPR